jgi:hypothetical protein
MAFSASLSTLRCALWEIFWTIDNWPRGASQINQVVWRLFYRLVTTKYLSLFYHVCIACTDHVYFVPVVSVYCRFGYDIQTQRTGVLKSPQSKIFPRNHCNCNGVTKWRLSANSCMGIHNNHYTREMHSVYGYLRVCH